MLLIHKQPVPIIVDVLYASEQEILVTTARKSPNVVRNDDMEMDFSNFREDFCGPMAGQAQLVFEGQGFCKMVVLNGNILETETISHGEIKATAN